MAPPLPAAAAAVVLTLFAECFDAPRLSKRPSTVPAFVLSNIKHHLVKVMSGNCGEALVRGGCSGPPLRIRAEDSPVDPPVVEAPGGG